MFEMWNAPNRIAQTVIPSKIPKVADAVRGTLGKFSKKFRNFAPDFGQERVWTNNNIRGGTVRITKTNP